MKVLKISFKLKSKELIIIIIFILFLNLYPGFFINVRAAGNDITVFILDTAVDNDFVKHGIVADSSKVSHGSMVGRIINEEAPEVNLQSLAIDNNKDITGEDAYLNGLKTVLKYKKRHPQQRVLVNISLAFHNYKDRHHDLIKQLYNKGVLMIAAAGNDNTDRPVFPAGFNEVVAVANASKRGKAPTSNYGEYIDISAEGSIEFISRLYLPTGIGYHTLEAEGTSFAAPRVTGLTAKLLNIKPDLSPEKALEIVKKTAASIEDKRFAQGQLGAGTINTSRALNRVRPYYQLKKILYSLTIMLSILLISLLLIQKYGLASIFLSLLILLVVLPFSLALINQLIPVLTLFHNTIKEYNLNPFDLIIISSSFIFILIFTGWEKRFLITVYTIITAGFWADSVFFNTIINKTYLLLLYSITALILMTYETWFVRFIRKKANAPLQLLRHINSYSAKISSSACCKIISVTNGEIDKNIKKIVLNNLQRDSRNKVSLNLLKLLIYSSNPPIKELISFALKHKCYSKDLINLFISRGEDIIIPLFEVLYDHDYDRKKMAGEILKELNNKKVISVIEKYLEPGQKIDKVILLEILASYGKQASHLTEKMKEIIFQSRDMWLRYQALKTLVAIHHRPQQLSPLLYKLTSDHQELIRLEAKGIIDDMEKEKGRGDFYEIKR